MTDFRAAARSLAARPGFSLMIVAMLALGIAGNAAIFSIFNGLFLRPLPFPHSERFVDLDETAPKWNLRYVGVSQADACDWRKGATAFAGLAFFDQRSANLTGRGTAERVHISHVNWDLLKTLGLSPALGRSFTEPEDRPGGPNVAMLGYGLWQRLFGKSPAALGQTIELDKTPYTIVGVLPPSAVVPHEAEVWVPLAPDPTNTQSWYLSGIGKLKPGVSVRQAQADLTRVHRAQVQSGRKVNEITSPVVTPFRDRHLGDMKPVSFILLGAVAIVLLIACVNVAGLMLVRGAGRMREIAIRAALGASRSRIARQLFAESLLLAAAGGIAGVALGRVLLRGLIALMPEDLPRWIVFSLDARIVLFALAVTGAAAVLFGLAPAWQAARADARGCLQEAAPRSGMSRRGRRLLGALVAGEVALALVLLVGAGLLLQAFRKVLNVDPGFRPQNVLTFGLAMPYVKYWKAEPRIAFFDQLLARLRALPGVEHAGIAAHPPLGGHSGTFFEVEGGRPRGKDESTPVTLLMIVSPGYFDAAGVTFLSGRQFDARDGVVAESPCEQPPRGTPRSKIKMCPSPLPAGPDVAIVNETFAKTFWGGGNPVGKRLRFAWQEDKWMQVVALTRDVRHYGLDEPVRPSVYVPYRRSPNNTMSVVIRTAIDPVKLIAPARAILRAIDPDVPMAEPRTLTESLNRSLWVRRGYSSLFAGFAAVALLLAIAGIYGVVSYAVAQRTREIGVKIALGARPRQVMAEVLRHGMLLASAGAAIGLAVSAAAARLLQSVLFGVSPRDPLVYIGVTAGVAAIALAANLLPARAAATVDPMRALRFE